MSDPVPYSRIGVLGAGAWGTALALTALAAGRQTLLWAREDEVLEAVRHTRRNPFLPDVTLPENLNVTDILNEAAASEALLVAVPAQVLGIFLARLAPMLAPGTPLVICAKGIEKDTGRLMHEVAAEAAPGAVITMLSGPSFARDVARGLPTAVTIAAGEDVAARLQQSLNTPVFRPYASDDVVGVALGGAAKNVYAIGCGVVEGLGLGENARAALLARSFAELARLGEALGARRETLVGLSGLGDLVLTATSISSRNFSFGVELGRGKTQAELDTPGHPLAEGVATAPALVKRARQMGVELPVAEAIADLISGTLPLGEAVMRLMSRRLKAE